MHFVDPKKDTIIVDLDGTLALDHHRAHHIQGMSADKRDWDTYFALCGDDEPNWDVIKLVRVLSWTGFNIAIVSGRRADTLEITKHWLEKHSVPYQSLFMRPVSDRTQDTELKLNYVREGGFTARIWFVLEDRQRVVDAWRSAGFTCLQVAPGNF